MHGSADQVRKRSVWHDYGLSIVLASLFFLAWAGQAVAEWFVVQKEAESHGEVATVGDFLVQFGQSTLENWQSEFLQLLTFVVLTAFLIHRGSHESKDGEDEMRAALNRIEQRLHLLEQRTVEPAGWRLPPRLPHDDPPRPPHDLT
jgi:hypothetical protein